MLPNACWTFYVYLSPDDACFTLLYLWLFSVVSWLSLVDWVNFSWSFLHEAAMLHTSFCFTYLFSLAPLNYVAIYFVCLFSTLL